MPYDSSFVLFQVLAVVPRQQFQRCVSRHRDDYKVKRFTTHGFFLCQNRLSARVGGGWLTGPIHWR
ncbi:MAG: DUF4372 domain-containing protein [Verrucomicrobiales bacterium]